MVLQNTLTLMAISPALKANFRFWELHPVHPAWEHFHGVALHGGNPFAQGCAGSRNGSARQQGLDRELRGSRAFYGPGFNVAAVDYLAVGSVCFPSTADARSLRCHART